MKINEEKIAEMLFNEFGMFSKKRWKKILDYLEDEIIDQVTQDNVVYLYGLGKFSRIFVKQRKGINPSTKKAMTIPAHYRAKFTPAKPFKDKINNR